MLNINYIKFNKDIESVSNVPNDVYNKNNEEKIIGLIINNKNVTREQMAQALEVSTKTISRIIQKSSRIKRIGSPKNGHWEIIM